MPRSKPTAVPLRREQAVTAAMLEWYDHSRRRLPWRAMAGDIADPYRVWLSEIMLQQTTVAAVKPYFLRFVSLWPDVEALAKAERDEVMREWAGLGYYARARNLHACAQAVVARHGGTFPSTEAELRDLPGIGDYTGAAIAAIAFNRAATVVDGNVERVVSRLFAIETPLPGSKPLIRRLAADLVSTDRPGDLAQATMDLGATLCTPKQPACGLCPIRLFCQAREKGIERDLPRRTAKKTRPQRFGATAVIARPDGAVLVRTRPETGLLGGMAEFLGTSWTEEAPDPAPLRKIADIAFTPKGAIDHVFTHFALRIDVYAGECRGGPTPEGCRWVPRHAVEREPWSSLMLKVMAAARAPEPASVLVALDGDGLGLIGLEGRDQQHRRKGKNRKA